MGRLVSCLVASVVLHGVVWGWMAARFSSWKRAVAQDAPPEPIEVETVVALPVLGGSGGGGGGGGGAAPVAPKRARVARAPSLRAADVAAPTPTPAPAASETGEGSGESAGPAAGAGSGAGSGVGAGPGAGAGAGAGSGPGSGSGRGSGAGAGSGASAGVDIAALVQARILAHRRYPLLARKQGIEGTVEVVFRVDAAGNAVDLRVDKSAGQSLDAAALDAVRAAAPLPSCAQPLRVPIRFRLVDERAIR